MSYDVIRCFAEVIGVMLFGFLLQ